MASQKTNAMRILDRNKINYEVHTYDAKDGNIDGVSVAAKIGKQSVQVYKTLVAQGISKEIYVFIIGVESELDLKKAAKAANEKKVEMLPVKDLQKLTGYVRGGCSPIGMKKHYVSFLDDDAKKLETIVVSAGKIGMQIEMTPDDLLATIGGTFVDLCK